MLYYFRQAIDEPSDTDLTLYRYASPNIKLQGEFGNYRAKHGLEAALPLFRKITFTWIENSKNPVGDMMSSFIFSPRAAELIRSMRCELEFFEPIDIEGIPAIAISLKRIDGIRDDLDIFRSKQYRMATVVSERFKIAWEAAGLLGAEFEPIQES